MPVLENLYPRKTARFAAWGFFVFRLCAMCAASIRAPLVAMPRALSRFAGLLDKLLGPVPKAAAPALTAEQVIIKLLRQLRTKSPHYREDVEAIEAGRAWLDGRA